MRERRGDSFFEIPEAMKYVTPELHLAASEAWNEAAHPYGDEGEGYEADVALAHIMEALISAGWEPPTSMEGVE